MIPQALAGGWKWVGDFRGLEGWWAREEAAAKWLPSLPVSIKAKMSVCSASGCDTWQAANSSDANNGVKNHI